ncbi:hypothetical protein AHAS_Ahas20G0127500 [Arachis hypogaea]
MLFTCSALLLCSPATLNCTSPIMASANIPSEIPSSQEQRSTPNASIGTQKNNEQKLILHGLIKGGGIHRFKLHLAGKGGDIESCRKVPTAVRHQFHQSIEELRSKKRKTQEQYAKSYNACDDVEREFDEIERNEMQQQQKSRVPAPISRKGKQVKCLQSYFPSAITPGAQPTIKSVLQSKEIVEKCDIANMSLQSPLDDLDQLDLEDDRDDDGANNSVENANQNETNQDVAPHLSDEEQFADFEITPWI